MSKSPAALSLEELRGKIDAIDVQLQQLISERARVARQVGEVKGLSRTADFYRPEREAQVLRKVVERNKGPLRDEEMVRLIQHQQAFTAAARLIQSADEMMQELLNIGR